jgi:flagellar hook-associated protein 2
VTASVVNGGQQLQLSANDYGSSEGFSVTSDTAPAGGTGLGGGVAGTATSYAGLDVAGTINGVAATGSGQVLSAPTSDKTLNGLALDITATGISSATDLGSFTYSPGIAQQLSTLASEMGTAGSGALSSEVTGLQAEATGLNSTIANYQALEASQKTLLQNEFAKMETTLGSLKNQSSPITSVLTGIAANP